MKFTVTCEMKDRWVPHFLAMLKYMEQLGGLGGSRLVSFYADGDGDFRPKFKFRRPWLKPLPKPAKPRKDEKGNRTYDAG
jgi:hypothetical protein